MGMDLIPVKPTEQAPTDKYGIRGPSYNWTDWYWLKPHIMRWRTCGGYEQR